MTITFEVKSFKSKIKDHKNIIKNSFPQKTRQSYLIRKDQTMHTNILNFKKGLLVIKK